jgi:transcriptional regulator with XRE-family HTH domain
MNLHTIGKQIAAARALADWSAAELGARAGLTKDAILKIEAGAVQPRAGTIADITAALAAVGVEFTERGVRLADDAIKVLEGEDAYLKMLDDIYYAIHKSGGEVLFMYSSDRHTHPGEYEAELRIREAGGRFRSLVEEGIKTTIWPAREYRLIPKKYFNHDLQIIYADKVAQAINGGEKILLIRNASLAKTACNTFNLLWSQLRPLPKTGHGHG